MADFTAHSAFSCLGAAATRTLTGQQTSQASAPQKLTSEAFYMGKHSLELGRLLCSQPVLNQFWANFGAISANFGRPRAIPVSATIGGILATFDATLTKFVRTRPILARCRQTWVI